MEEIELTKSQKRAYEALMNGENVFLTGGAGTGKTTLITKFIQDVDPYCRNTLLAAPTGKAALNLEIVAPDGTKIQGSTVHRLFKLKAAPVPEYKGTIPPIIHTADRIIIDEISMMRMDLFEYVADVLMDEMFVREFEGRSLQIILVGDFFQLPPVLPDKAPEGMSDKEILNKRYGEDVGKGYCFQCAAWELLDIKKYELTEIMRQKGDDDFCEALNKIRIGDPTGIRYINENCDHSKMLPDRITLCGTNAKVDAINEAMERRSTNRKVTFQWDLDIKIPSNNIEKFLKNVPCSKHLTLWVGARVICIANCTSAMNGQTGEITEINEDGVEVKWDNGITNTVTEYLWELNRQTAEKNEFGEFKLTTKTVLTISQLPLKVAYAITIHRSQGTTYEAANIYTSTFETGQLYTALSRCRTVSNMRLYQPIKSQDLIHDPKINDFYYGGENHEEN